MCFIFWPLFGLATVLTTFQTIVQLFPNHLVTLGGMKVVKAVLNTVEQVSLLGSITKYA